MLISAQSDLLFRILHMPSATVHAVWMVKRFASSGHSGRASKDPPGNLRMASEGPPEGPGFKNQENHTFSGAAAQIDGGGEATLARQ